VPSDSATYILSGVKDAIRGATGSDAIVECNRNTAGEAQLYQVYLCVAPDGSGLVDCPEPLLRNCGDKIKFPAF
jgi:ribonuclease T2